MLLIAQGGRVLMKTTDTLEKRIISPLHSQELIMARLYLPPRVYRVAEGLFKHSKEYDARMYIAKQYLRAREHALEHKMYKEATIFHEAYERTTSSCALPHCNIL